MSANGVIQLGTGELMAASAALMLAFSTVFYNVRLGHIPVGIYVVTRSAVCAPAFFLTGLALHGGGHLVGLAAPTVWPWICAYAVVFGLIGPVIWIAGLRSAHPVSVQAIAALTPLLAVVGSAVWLGRAPTTTQYIGGAVVAIGLLVGVVGTLREYGSMHGHLSPGSVNAVDSGIGFKGV
jgi:drug/metabolite transporter (DMT)-like permease